MIRGSLDHVDAHWVSGWIYSAERSVSGARVLACLRGRCIGDGVISRRRPDLAEAGLGDEVVGFGFPIDLPSSGAPFDVYVKLEGSDFILPNIAWLRSIEPAQFVRRDEIVVQPARPSRIDERNPKRMSGLVSTSGW